MPKRSRGEGSVFESPPASGRWFWQDSGYAPSGKRMRRTRGPLASRELAAAAGRRVRRDDDAGVNAAAEQQSLAAYLESWLSLVVAPAARPSTIRVYTYQVNYHITPRLGGARLGRIAPQHVRALLAQVQATGVSAATVSQTRRVLHAALAQAVEDDLLRRNPVDAVKAPRQDHTQRTTLSVEQVRVLLAHVLDDRLAALYATAIALGLRRGELLGLRWEDVDLELGWLRVTQQLQRRDGRLQGADLKTSGSARAVPLPLFVRKALEVHRLQQEREREGQTGPGETDSRLMAPQESPLKSAEADTRSRPPMLTASLWEDHGLVFTTKLGRPLMGDNVSRAFRAHLVKAELPAIRFHDLRGSTSSLLAEFGVAPRVVQRILGHSNVGTTLGLYTFAKDPQLEDAMRRLDEALEI